MSTTSSQPNSEPEAPKRLAADLRKLGRTPAVPHEVDAAVMNVARRRFARPSRCITVIRWGGAAAAAAAIVIVVLFSTLTRRVQTGPAVPAMPAVVAAAREDVDRSGRVDILDAFALARKADARQASTPEWDLNGDGVVDKKDVDIVALAAVSVGKGQVSL